MWYVEGLVGVHQETTTFSLVGSPVFDAPLRVALSAKRDPAGMAMGTMDLPGICRPRRARATWTSPSRIPRAGARLCVILLPQHLRGYPHLYNLLRRGCTIVGHGKDYVALTLDPGYIFFDHQAERLFSHRFDVEWEIMPNRRRWRGR